MKVTFKKLSGGYEFDNFAGKPEDIILDVGIPERVIIPLAQEFGEEALPTVKAGENVEAGQIIAIDNDSVSNPVHSTVNGLVEEITRIDLLGKEVQAVAVKSDGTSGWQIPGPQNTQWSQRSREDLEEILYMSGVASLGKEGIPTRHKSSPISPDRVRHIIIHGVESELYAPSLNVLLGGDNLRRFTEGMQILNTIIPNARIHLALNGYQKRIIKRLFSLMEEYDWINAYLLEPKYPQELDQVILSTILDRRIPHGSSPARIGVIILDIQAILHIYEAVVEGKPLIEKIVALGGSGFKSNYHARMRIGTTLEHLTRDKVITDKKVRFVRNNPLTGEALSDPDSPFDRQCTSISAIPEKTTRQFLSFVRPGSRKDAYSRTFLSKIPILKKQCDTNIHGEERSCISCSYCDEICPAKIIPHLIYKYVERDLIDENLLNLGIFDCVDCNLCNYVCPSKISIAKIIREGKEKLIEQGFVSFTDTSSDDTLSGE